MAVVGNLPFVVFTISWLTRDCPDNATDLVGKSLDRFCGVSGPEVTRWTSLGTGETPEATADDTDVTTNDPAISPVTAMLTSRFTKPPRLSPAKLAGVTASMVRRMWCVVRSVQELGATDITVI